MAGHNYGDMWVSGGCVLNGDVNISTVTNGLLLNPSQTIELDEVLQKLTRAADQCRAIEDDFAARRGKTQSIADLARDVTAFRAASISLLIHIEDACLEGWTPPAECAKLLYDVVEELGVIQGTVDELHHKLRNDGVQEPEDDAYVCSSMDIDSLGRKLTSTRELVVTTMFVVFYSMQVQAGVVRPRAIAELKRQVQDMQNQLEHQALSMMPPGPPLQQCLVEQVQSNVDKSSIIRRYLEHSPYHRMSGTPSTASIQSKQVSSIMPSLISEDMSFCTAQPALSLPSHPQSYVPCEMQLFIKGIPDQRTVLVRVSGSEHVDNVWWTLRQRFAFLPPSGVFRRANGLAGADTTVLDGTLASNGIESLETLFIGWGLPCVPSESIFDVTVVVPGDTSYKVTPRNFRWLRDRENACVRDLHNLLSSKRGHCIYDQRLLNADKTVWHLVRLRDISGATLKLVSMDYTHRIALQRDCEEKGCCHKYEAEVRHDNREAVIRNDDKEEEVCPERDTERRTGTEEQVRPGRKSGRHSDRARKDRSNRERGASQPTQRPKLSTIPEFLAVAWKDYKMGYHARYHR